MLNSLLALLNKRHSGDQLTKDGMGEVCSTCEEKWNTHFAIVNKVEVQSILVRPRRRWEENSKIDLMVWSGLKWLRIGTNFLEKISKILSLSVT
jgi:glutathione peroxidase-family protein